MLGDFAHHTSYSLHSLFQVLEAWLNKVESENITCELTLILEFSEYDAKNVEKYLKSGKTENLWEIVSVLGNIEDLEYYEDLRAFKQSMEKSKAFKEKRISFKVGGFEPFGTDFSSDFSKKTRLKR
jgi:hypothetical protein